LKEEAVSKIARKDRVYCSGLWKVEGNIKNTSQHYDALLPLTFDLISGSKLRFFSDDAETLDRVAALCESRTIDVEMVHREIEDLPAWEISSKIVRSTKRMQLDCFKRPPKHAGPNNLNKEKAFAHYWRDLKRSNADVYQKVLTIWMSKVGLSASLASNTTETCHVVWIDASIAKLNGRRPNWNFSKEDFPFGKLSHYGSHMTFYGYRLPLSACLLGGDAATWKHVSKEFHETARKAAQMPYGHDEETILSACHWSQPDLFHRINRPIPRVLSPFWKIANQRYLIQRKR
jgi:hypothetical protein